MRRWAAALLLAPLAAAVPADRGMAVHHATGTFAVTITPEAQGEPPAGGLPTARMGVAKTFSGPLAGTAVGTMLSAGTPGPGKAAAYVAVDQFSGTLDGRVGGFLLLHRGAMTRTGDSELSVVIAPDSGTGALAGIEGTLDIKVEGGVHRYDLAYTLPGAQ